MLELVARLLPGVAFWSTAVVLQSLPTKKKVNVLRFRCLSLMVAAICGVSVLTAWAETGRPHADFRAARRVFADLVRAVGDGRPPPVLELEAVGPRSPLVASTMVTADLVLYDPASPPPRSEVTGKIAVVQLIPETDATPTDQRIHTRPGDYVFLSSPETFPDPDFPRQVSTEAGLGRTGRSPGPPR